MGAVVFDAPEFRYVEEREKESVPTELRPMFDRVWIDLDADSDDDGPTGFLGYAMAAKHTGVAVTAADLASAVRQGYHRVRTLTYRE